MKFSEADSGSGHPILGYDPGRIRIGGQVYTQGLIVSPEHIEPGWGPKSATDLTAEHFAALAALDPRIVIVGTGKRQVFPDPNAYRALLRRGLGVDIMDTGAACRTYNILMSEGRRVVAGLLMC
ncbi:MAG: Mth938-like domain-containing protein [Candidatus Thiosymbion ectosymbiont of Robbea hypermnestra]|nr:Mth938-like domain-containing protein [Candidatus Thiosymbion ectosymbiont of Robbea hypermnestra]